MPMLRAVPAITRQAASSLCELRSAIFAFAISRTCLRVTLPTLLRFGSALAVAMPAAFFSSALAGGDLVMNVKVLSL